MVEEPQNRRTRVTKGLKVSLFPGLSPSALKVPSGRAAPGVQPALCPSVRLSSPDTLSVLCACGAHGGREAGWREGRGGSGSQNPTGWRGDHGAAGWGFRCPREYREGAGRSKQVGRRGAGLREASGECPITASRRLATGVCGGETS